MSEKRQVKSGYKEELKTSMLNFASEVGNYIAIVATAVVTMSLSIFMDLVNSTCNLLRTGICTFLSIKLQKNQRFKYNYGTDNLETVAMLLCELLLTIGTGAVMIFAISGLFNPSVPGESLLVGVLYKAWCVFVDLLLLITAWRVYKKTGTKVAKSNFAGTLGGTAFDFAIFLTVLLAHLFRNSEFVAYVEPVASILIALYVIFASIKRIREYVKELTYETLGEADQLKIATILAHHFDRFEDFFSVNSRKAGSTVYVDFLISFPDETTYGEIVEVLKSVTKELEAQFEDCRVSIIFDNENLITKE